MCHLSTLNLSVYPHPVLLFVHLHSVYLLSPCLSIYTLYYLSILTLYCLSILSLCCCLSTLTQFCLSTLPMFQKEGPEDTLLNR